MTKSNKDIVLAYVEEVYGSHYQNTVTCMHAFNNSNRVTSEKSGELFDWFINLATCLEALIIFLEKAEENDEAVELLDGAELNVQKIFFG